MGEVVSNVIDWNSAATSLKWRFTWPTHGQQLKPRPPTYAEVGWASGVPLER